jgi:hypothetical protein
LEVAEDADEKDIKKAYRTWAAISPTKPADIMVSIRNSLTHGL